jgi:hypothetical protein
MAPLVAAAVLIGPAQGTAAASSCAGWISMPIPSPGSSTNTLSSVAVLSPHLAWAVGGYSSLGAGRTLIERWDGTAWKQQASPNPGGRDSADGLAAVAASSPSDAWAVGGYSNLGPGGKTLIEHWDGTSWTHVPSPNPKGYDLSLNGVAATSPSNAWAVGSTGYQPLIEHWDGAAWRRVSTPDIGGFTGVSASSPSNAWAVGSFWDGTQDRTLTLHWDGTAWAPVPSPSVAHADSGLGAVTTTSPTSAWAVGWYTTGSIHAKTLILHWNGTTWSKVNSPNFLPQPSINALSAVSASSPTNIWSVGYFAATATTEQLAALHRC